MKRHKTARRGFLTGALGGAIAAWGLARQWARGAIGGRGSKAGAPPAADRFDTESRARPDGQADDKAAEPPIWIGHI